MTQYVDRHQCDGVEDHERKLEKFQSLADALEEADDLADYIEGQYVDLRCKELDIQHDAEGGPNG